MGSAWEAVRGVMVRDLRLGIARRGELAQPLLFFVLVVSLFPLGIGPGPQTLALVGPGVIWVAALLATLLAGERLFRSDYDDGSLEQLVLSPHPTWLLVLGKVAAHWLLTGLPLILVAPVLAVLLNLSGEAMGALAVTLLLGTPTLSLVAAIGVALTVSLRRGGVLLTLLVLPLYVPVLIFATAAVSAAASGLPWHGQLALLGALLALALITAPFAAAAGLRINLE